MFNQPFPEIKMGGHITFFKMKYLKYFKTEADYTTYKDGEDFILPNVSYVVDANSVFYHVVKTETGDYKIFLVEKKNISGLTYNMVDLGLPSGLLWADRNVGASAPEDFGTYFSWGETTGYNASTGYCTAAELCAYLQPLLGDQMQLTPDNIDEFLSNIQIEGKDLTVYGGDMAMSTEQFSYGFGNYFDTTDGGTTFNKYATDKLRVLQPEDDAATVNIGSEYRMPTREDFNELINNCTMTYFDINNKEFSASEVKNGSITGRGNFKGIKFTGSNGNSIFIPMAGSLSYYQNGIEDLFYKGFL
jgi:hypothetical protein